jgi:hypothetical protein
MTLLRFGVTTGSTSRHASPAGRAPRRRSPDAFFTEAKGEQDT